MARGAWRAWAVAAAGALGLTAAGLAAGGPVGQAPLRIRVTSVAGALVTEGLALAAPDGPSLAAFADVPSPGLRSVPNDATATSSPWIDSNAWRFARGLRRVRYVGLPAGAASLAAAEAFGFDVEAVIDPAPADVAELRNVLTFLRAHDRPAMPVRANVGVLESDSPLFDEVLNMLTRRNLLYRVVAQPDPGLDLTVRLGSSEFPMESAVNPSDFAARVREALGDDKRLVRLYGTNTVIARLTGDGARARLVLLNFNRNRNTQNQTNVRVRLLGRHRLSAVAAYGAAPGAGPDDVRQLAGATEFTLPIFGVIAIVDLDTIR